MLTVFPFFCTRLIQDLTAIHACLDVLLTVAVSLGRVWMLTYVWIFVAILLRVLSLETTIQTLDLRHVTI